MISNLTNYAFHGSICLKVQTPLYFIMSFHRLANGQWLGSCDFLAMVCRYWFWCSVNTWISSWFAHAISSAHLLSFGNKPTTWLCALVALQISSVIFGNVLYWSFLTNTLLSPSNCMESNLYCFGHGCPFVTSLSTNPNIITNGNSISSHVVDVLVQYLFRP